MHVRAKVLEAIKTTLDANGIDMPYDTRVMLFHDQTEETDGIRGAQRQGWPKNPSGRNPAPRKRPPAPRQSLPAGAKPRRGKNRG